MKNKINFLKSPDLNRQTFLRAWLVLTVILITQYGPTFAQSPDKIQKSLAFYNLHTEEHLSVIYCIDGQYQSDALQAIEHIFRDHRTGDTHVVDPELLDILHTLHSLLGASEPFQIISAYRSTKTNAMLAKRSAGVANKSLHMHGMAIDVRLPGLDLAKVRDMALSMKMGGVGYYPKSNFIHLDTGRVRSW